MNKLKIYLPSVLIPLLSGGIVGILISGSMDYDKLNQPALAPPSILFSIVWTILYILMGISTYLILESKGQNKEKALILYGVQLILNASWTYFFFNLNWFLFSFILVIIILILLIYMIKEFHKINPLAAYLQLPYVLWLIFAAILSYNVYLLN